MNWQNRALDWALALLMAGAGSLAAQSNPGQVLGMAMSPRSVPAPTTQDYIDAVVLAHGAGVHGNEFTVKWSDLEPSAGNLQIADFTDGMNSYLSYFADTALLGIQVINTTAKETPADLQTVSFDDPQMLQRFNALIDALLAKITHPIRYLSVGNEVDVYLAAHPDQWTAYQSFYEGAVAHIHQVAPEIQVGVTVTYSGAQSHPDEVRRLNRRSDLFIVTYYALASDFSVRSPDAPLTDFPRIIDMAGGLPVILQEVGYPSADRLGSSEELQAAFVQNVFAAWKSAGSAIPFLDFFLLHDMPDNLCSTLESYYGVKNANFHAYLCTLGLRNADGSPKLSWDAFVQAAARWQNQSS